MTPRNSDVLGVFCELVAVADDVSGGRIGYHVAQVMAQKNISTVVPFVRKGQAITFDNIAPLPES